VEVFTIIRKRRGLFLIAIIFTGHGGRGPVEGDGEKEKEKRGGYRVQGEKDLQGAWTSSFIPRR